MTDLPPSPDDEIVSAVLDGEATDDERARVASDPELARRLTELRGVSTAVAEPVAPLDELTAHRLVDRAIDDAGAGPAPPRTSPRWWQSGLGVGIGSAAVVVLLALAVVPVLLSGGGSDDDSATADLETTEADGGEAGDDAGSLADDGARAPDAAQEAAPPGDDAGDGDADLGARQWLGSFDTADELAAALPQRLNEPGTADADPTTTTSTATSAFGAHDDLAELVPECPAGPGGTWPAELQPPFEVFDALIDDTAVVVITGIDAAGEPIVVVVETGTCAPVELP
ncbi:MAG: hypothetical protein ACLFWR_03580 [Acidimicrobiales bacterium]